MATEATLRLLNYQKFTLAAGEVRPFNDFFTTCSILSVNDTSGAGLPTGSVTLSLNDQSESKIFGGFYFEANNFDEYVQRAVFKNTTAADAVVEVVFAAGKTEDRRLTLSSAVTIGGGAVGISNGTTGTTSQTTVTTSSAVVLATNANRRQATIYNEGPNDVYLGVGGAASTTTGFKIPVGGTFVYSSTRYLAMRTSTSTSLVYVLEELA